MKRALRATALRLSNDTTRSAPGITGRSLNVPALSAQANELRTAW